MTTNAAPPGWHPDPSNPGSTVRWWDGLAWTDHTQSATAAPVTSGVPASSYGATTTATATTGYGMTAASPTTTTNYGMYAPVAATFTQRNKTSLIAIAVVAAYIVIAFTTRFVFIGIAPIMMSVRATQRKEPFAPLAIIAAIIAVGVAFLALK